MESTGVYVKLVFNILKGSELTNLTAYIRHINYAPGYKTDKKDSALIAKLLLAGHLKGSFVPPVEIRNIYDLMLGRTDHIKSYLLVIFRTNSCFHAVVTHGRKIISSGTAKIQIAVCLQLNAYQSFFSSNPCFTS